MKDSKCNLTLCINKKRSFRDDLSIMLTSFSYKKSYVGGPEKSTAYMILFRGSNEEIVSLSMYQIEQKTNYDILYWKEYAIKLKTIRYGESIEVEIVDV